MLFEYTVKCPTFVWQIKKSKNQLHLRIEKLSPHILINGRRSRIFFIVDILFVSVTFLIFAWIKPATVRLVLPKYGLPFLCFLLIWIATSLLSNKYKFNKKQKKLVHKLKSVLGANIIIVAISLTLLYYFQLFGFSRLLIFGTIGTTTILEMLLIWQILAYNRINRFFFYESKFKKRIEIVEDHQKTQKLNHEFSSSIKDEIIKMYNEKVYQFIRNNISIEERDIFFTITRQAFNIKNKALKHKAIVNLQSLNTLSNIHAIIEATNHQLPMNGLYFSVSETIVTRKKRILSKYPAGINYIVYFFDYLYHRVFAKSYPTRFIYKKLNHKNRAISKAEILGRLYAAGFELVKDIEINGHYLCVSKKVAPPKKIDYETVGSLIKLKRLGKDGKIIGVYKFRTMHPFSEFIQAYVYEHNALQEGGKFKDDFRINHVGKILRRFWLDEFPMFINIFKGDMKLIGVRPLSEHYFNLYHKELQDLRITTKPGLLPPFYADNPETLDEIMESEMRYLKAYKAHPIKTDISYFIKILYNIIIKRKRSK